MVSVRRSRGMGVPNKIAGMCLCFSQPLRSCQRSYIVAFNVKDVRRCKLFQSKLPLWTTVYANHGKCFPKNSDNPVEVLKKE